MTFYIITHYYTNIYT